MLHLLGTDAEHAIGEAVHGLVLAVDRFALTMIDRSTPARWHG